jgi:hypothetical protein
VYTITLSPFWGSGADRVRAFGCNERCVDWVRLNPALLGRLGCPAESGFLRFCHYSFLGMDLRDFEKAMSGAAPFQDGNFVTYLTKIKPRFLGLKGRNEFNGKYLGSTIKD